MRLAVKPWLTQIWHAPDHLRLMDPLPPLHRRGIILGFACVILGFLLPGGGNDSGPVTRDAQLSVSSELPLQAELTPATNNSAPATQVEPHRVEEQTRAPVLHDNNDIEQQWRSYRVAAGQTMAQLFRDHNLPPADVYAMAQVEGDSKPLSNLQTGQMVQIRQNSNGVVTGLTIDIGNDQQVLFTRQPNGSFIRAQ